MPELNTSDPLVPLMPPLELVMIILPLLVAVPSPLCTANSPPVLAHPRPDNMQTAPPDPLVPLPVLSIISPPRPPVAVPVPIWMAPLFPCFALPELKMSLPLSPLDPALGEQVRIAPLLDAVPSPAATATDPPVLELLRPASINTVPPIPLVPLPTLATTAPPRPPVEAPDPRERLPLFPPPTVPELKVSLPLAPAPPPFDVKTLNIPLLVVVPSPELTRINPPVLALDVLRPPMSATAPPTPLVPLPELIVICPDRPPVDEPVPIHSAPLFPYLAVPELNDNFPLEPVAPEFAVDIDILPELVVVPSPLRTKTSPPEDGLLRPACRRKKPP